MKKKHGRNRGRKKGFPVSAFLYVFLVWTGLFIWTKAEERDYNHEDVICEANSPISREERIKKDSLYKYEDRLQDLETGDILLTPCSHVFGWRNGHAAIVVDAEKGLTLESVVLGTPSSIQNVSKWRGYPGVLVLRLKEATAEERKRIAKYAVETMNGMDYGVWEEFAEHFLKGEMRDTHCAHLIWRAYLEFGYDIDGDGGIIVTPKDISLSEQLQVIEKHNVDNW